MQLHMDTVLPIQESARKFTEGERKFLIYGSKLSAGHPFPKFGTISSEFMRKPCRTQ
jgi:hypothetical protein